MVTFVQSYSYNRPFDGSHNTEVALSENEFDTTDLHSFFLYSTKHIIAFYQARPTTLRDFMTVLHDILKNGKGASSRRDSCKM